MLSPSVPAHVVPDQLFIGLQNVDYLIHLFILQWFPLANSALAVSGLDIIRAQASASGFPSTGKIWGKKIHWLFKFISGGDTEKGDYLALRTDELGCLTVSAGTVKDQTANDEHLVLTVFNNMSPKCQLVTESRDVKRSTFLHCEQTLHLYTIYCHWAAGPSSCICSK